MVWQGNLLWQIVRIEGNATRFVHFDAILCNRQQIDRSFVLFAVKAQLESVF